MLADPTSTVDPVDGSSTSWKRISSGPNSSTWRTSTSTPGDDWTDMVIRHQKAGNSAKPNSSYIRHNINIVRSKRDADLDKIDKVTVNFTVTAPEASDLTPTDVVELCNTATGLLVVGSTETPLASGTVLAGVLFGES